MNEHPTAKIDEEDRRLGRRDMFWPAFGLGFGAALAFGSFLVGYGII